MTIAIVLGATGAVGSALINELENTPEITRIIAITRSPKKYGNHKIENLVIDFEQLNKSKHLINGDILFSCLGTTKKQAGSIDAQRTVDVDYQYQIAGIAKKNGIEKFCLVSSSGANAHSLSPYLKMKGELENLTKALLFRHCFIFRPSLLLANREGFRFGETVGAYLMPVLGYLPLLRKYRPIHVEQVAKKLVAVALSESHSFAIYQPAELHS